MNTVILTGNVTKDTELKYTQSGKAYCNFTVASNKYVSGENVATFVNITSWGKQAEFVSKYFGKGSSVEIVGELHNNKRTIEGKEYTFTEVWRSSVAFGNKGKDNNGGTKAEASQDEFDAVEDNGDLPF